MAIEYLLFAEILTLLPVRPYKISSAFNSMRRFMLSFENESIFMRFRATCVTP